MRENRVYTELYDFAYFPNLWDSIRALAGLAAPESWQYKAPFFKSVCPEVEILAKYLRTVFMKNAQDFNAAEDEELRDLCICMRKRWACFHTGLNTEAGEPIYACLIQNARRDVKQRWVLHSFLPESHAWLDMLDVLPAYPAYTPPAYAEVFYLDWPILASLEKLTDTDRVMRMLPEALQDRDTLLPLAKTALRRSKRMAEQVPDFVAPLVHGGRIQYALPLYLHGDTRPELALVLDPRQTLEYMATALETPEMIYNDARLLGPVQTGWLTDLVVERARGRAGYRPLAANQHF